jgi:hypothetical protein
MKKQLFVAIAMIMSVHLLDGQTPTGFRHFSVMWSVAGDSTQIRQDWYQQVDGSWWAISPNHADHYRVTHPSVSASGVLAQLVENDDNSQIVLIPDASQSRALLSIASTSDGALHDVGPITTYMNTARPWNSQNASVDQVSRQAAASSAPDNTVEMGELQDRIQSDQSEADNEEQLADNSSCPGMFSAVCEAKAASLRREAKAHRDEIVQLQQQLADLGAASGPAYSDSSTSSGQASAATGGGSAPSGGGSSPSSNPYDPNAHYSGPNAGEVSLILSRTSGWSCPTSPTATVNWKPAVQQVCMRDSYVSAAMSLAYGAECESRMGRQQQAQQDAQQMMTYVSTAKSMCSSAPAVQTSGPGCTTLQIVTCP